MPKPVYTLDLDKLNWDDKERAEALLKANAPRNDLLPFILKCVGETNEEQFKANMTARSWALLNREFWRLFFGYDELKN